MTFKGGSFLNRNFLHTIFIYRTTSLLSKTQVHVDMTHRFINPVNIFLIESKIDQCIYMNATFYPILITTCTFNYRTLIYSNY